MNEEFLLLNPGPVPVSEPVRETMTEPMISHRSAAFESVYARAQSGLDYVFSQSTLENPDHEPSGQPLILNGTATLAMESAIANLVDPDDTVLALINGKFGRRFARIADRHCQVERIEAEWGSSFDLATIETALTQTTPDVVTMVHNETSTGLLNPVDAVGQLVADTDTHFIVDGVTSIGGDVFDIAGWNVDVAIVDAQKCLATPPGISAVYVTTDARSAIDGEEAPFYADLAWHDRKAADNQTPFTAAVPLFRALAESLDEIREEGMSARIRRHRRQAAAFRNGFTALGLSPFPNVTGPTDYSNTVTAMSLPEPVKSNPQQFFTNIENRNVSISGGQGHLAGRIFRVSNMGTLSEENILRGIRTVGEALSECDIRVDITSGVSTAQEILSE